MKVISAAAGRASLARARPFPSVTGATTQHVISWRGAPAQCWQQRRTAVRRSAYGNVDGAQGSQQQYGSYGYYQPAPGGDGDAAAAAAAASSAIDGGGRGAAEPAWPSSNGSEYGDARDTAGSGWQQAGSEGGAGWGHADWGEYEPVGEWGQRERPSAQQQAAPGAWGAAAGPGASPAPEPGAWSGAEPGAAPGQGGGAAWGAAGGYAPFDADAYRSAGASSPPPPGGAAPGWVPPGGGVYSDTPPGAGPTGGWAGGALMPSDITLITPRDAELVLPVIPTTEQARHYQPKSVPE